MFIAADSSTLIIQKLSRNIIDFFIDLILLLDKCSSATLSLLVLVNFLQVLT